LTAKIYHFKFKTSAAARRYGMRERVALRENIADLSKGVIRMSQPWE
jgi:hypothetical protein